MEHQLFISSEQSDKGGRCRSQMAALSFGGGGGGVDFLSNPHPVDQLFIKKDFSAQRRRKMPGAPKTEPAPRNSTSLIGKVSFKESCYIQPLTSWPACRLVVRLPTDSVAETSDDLPSSLPSC